MSKIPPKTLVIVIAACLLGVILALVGAELPDDTLFIEALPFWLTITGTTAILLTTVGKAVSHLTEDIGASPLLRASIDGAVTIVLVALPVALMCLPIDGLLPDSDSLFSSPSSTASMSALFWGWADQYLNLLPAIAGFWLFAKALDLAFPATLDISTEHGQANESGDGLEKTADPNDGRQERGPSALERRFPEISGLKLLAIEADEHYVRLHTDVGSKHVLYRFRDALKDVEELSGLRVHRSWWVAEDAMEALEPGSSGLGIRLKGGLKAPVSQTYRRDVERTIEARSNQG